MSTETMRKALEFKAVNEIANEQDAVEFLKAWLDDGSDNLAYAVGIVWRAALAAPVGEAVAPIDMVMHCPKCGVQHIDTPDCRRVMVGGVHVDDAVLWENPPHRSHLCHGCGHIWRPADVPTNGVAAVKTSGKADSPIATPTPAAQAEPWRLIRVLEKGRELVYPAQIDADLKGRIERLGGKLIPVYLATPAVQAEPEDAVAGKCPTCGSECNERDELEKAEREIERLTAMLRAAPPAPQAVKKVRKVKPAFNPNTDCQKNHHECEAPEICGKCGSCMGA